MKKKALIFGISGQDGAYLSKFLLGKDYIVSGTTRNIKDNNLINLDYLGVTKKIKTYSASPTNYKDIYDAINKTDPDEIYNLSGQSSVGLSFKKPKDSFESIVLGNLYILDVIREVNPKIKFYNACSGECFGNTNGNAASETTAFVPCSPYAIAKLSTYWQTKLYREAYQLFACSGILFNHESPLRSDHFVTQKIISTAKKIANGSNEKLLLGDISIKRDWGWAPEYVDAMWRMLQIDKPDDFVIATGKSYKLEDFISITFERLDMNWKDHVVIDKRLYRPSEIKSNRGDASKANKILNWNAEYTMIDIIHSMLNAKKIIENKDV